MSDKIISHTVETEIPPNYLEKLLDYIHKEYLLRRKKQFINISKKTVDNTSFLNFTVQNTRGKQKFNVEITTSDQIKIKITPIDENIPEPKMNEIKQDIVILIEAFEEKIRNKTLYFAWREGEEIVPEKISGKNQKSIKHLFLETQILLFIVFIAFGMLLFFFVGLLTPIVLLIVQFFLIFYSNKIIARIGDWHIDEKNPIIHILKYQLSIKEHDELTQKYSRKELMEIKKEIYEKTLAKKKKIDCKTVKEIFAKHGIKCKPENLSAKKVNVYQLVKKVADKFGFRVPEIVISNTMDPNAAASGIDPKRGIVLITTGFLAQFKEDETISVLGHEFGHLKGHDPLILYGLTGAEFLFRFYVLLVFLPFIFIPFIFFIYFWIVMTVIYFIAKFFEERADIVSAMVIGQPKVLAESLEKLGFIRLLNERVPSFRVREWTSLDPHPPIYFRVNLLEKLKVPVKIKHITIFSIKSVMHGFFEALRS